VPVSKANGHKARVVLVVEDDFLVGCDVADELREAGYTVVETPSGEEANALCKSDMTIAMVFTGAF
jgi:DNA-binding response OmpR family regulator